MRGLDDKTTAQKMMDGKRIYYNFMRSHMTLDGKTPAQKAKIDVDSNQNWLSLIKKASKHQQTVIVLLLKSAHTLFFEVARVC